MGFAILGGMKRPSRLDIVLLAGWVLFALLTAFAMPWASLGLVPLFGLPVVFFIWPIPSLFLYATAGLAVFYALRAGLRRTTLAPAVRLALAIVVAVAAPLIAGRAVPALANARLEREIADLRRGELPPIRLTPVESVGLVSSAAPTGDPVCDAFCIALLRSGYAGSVFMADAGGSVSPSTHVMARRFVLAGDPRTCGHPGGFLENYDAPAGERSAGWIAAFREAFADCVKAAGSEPLAAQILMVDDTGRTRVSHGGAAVLGIDWRLVRLEATRRQHVYDLRAGGREVTRVVRFEAGRLLAPLFITPVEAGYGWSTRPGHWSDTPHPLSDDGPSRIWPWPVANGESIYRAALSGGASRP